MICIQCGEDTNLMLGNLCVSCAYKEKAKEQNEAEEEIQKKLNNKLRAIDDGIDYSEDK